MQKKISTILLAGGTGSRMNSAIPKQFLSLHNKLIAHYSFDLFLSIPEISEIIVVCSPEYHSYFSLPHASQKKLHFAPPGERRQDSVYHGFQAITDQDSVVCIHDAARPCITLPLFQSVLKAALRYGAATNGVPLKFTVKELDSKGMVQKTLDRSKLWEIQTPQMILYPLLQKGFEEVHSKKITVTDDVSLVEELNLPVQVIEGSYHNIKITTPDDLIFAHHFLKN
jgi:2-C-methyl-D-erythritol 4-phosphate cytidylyltransferase